MSNGKVFSRFKAIFDSYHSGRKSNYFFPSPFKFSSEQFLEPQVQQNFFSRKRELNWRIFRQHRSLSHHDGTWQLSASDIF